MFFQRSNNQEGGGDVFKHLKKKIYIWRFEGSENVLRTFREERSSNICLLAGYFLLHFRCHERAANSTLFTFDRGNERRWGWQRAGVSLVAARGGGAQLKPLEAHHHHHHTHTVFQTRSATHSDASPSQSQQTLPHNRFPSVSVSRRSAKVSDTHVTTAAVCEFTPAKAPWKWREIGQRAAVQMQR